MATSKKPATRAPSGESESEPDKIVITLAVSPFDDDRNILREIFSHTNWKLLEAGTCKEAVDIVRSGRIPVVLTECNLPDGKWQDILSGVTDTSNPPCLIVSSRLADERLWAEVLNEGGYDLLPKPFESREVTRVISLAWLHWKNQLERTLKRMRAG